MFCGPSHTAKNYLCMEVVAVKMGLGGTYPRRIWCFYRPSYMIWKASPKSALSGPKIVGAYYLIVLDSTVQM